MQIPSVNLDYFTPEQIQAIKTHSPTIADNLLRPVVEKLRFAAELIAASRHTSRTPEYDRGVQEALTAAADMLQAACSAR